MTATQAKYVRRAVQHGVLTLTLDRPQARNAMNLEMVQEMTAAIAGAEADSALRVLVLRGAGGHFCAGGDIKDFVRARSAPAAEGHAEAARINAAFGRMCLSLARSALPSVCVLEGAVLGGGFGLACASDIALASQRAVFGLPETSLGLVPAQIAPFLIERLGLSQAKRLALTGGRIGAQQALAVGLVHQVCDDAEALERALADTLSQLLSCAPQATRATKQLLLRARAGVSEEIIGHAASVFAAALLGSEGAEGTEAFVQKRPPAWKRGPG